MTAAIEKRVEALESVAASQSQIGIVLALEGETSEQAIKRLGLTGDGRLLYVVVPVKAVRKGDAG